MQIPPVEPLIQQIHRGGQVWLFLDYDGTLADFAPTPDEISVEAQVVNLLARLISRPGLRIAVISGRRLEHLQKLLPVRGLFLAGDYGIELQTPDGERLKRLDYAATRQVIQPLRPAWQALIEREKGFFLEDKGWSLALHARYAGDADAERILKAARQAAEPLQTGFKLLGGEKFLEIVPAGIDKGKTVAFLLEQYAAADTLPIYFGDDDKDELAFQVTRRRGGFTVQVGERSLRTQADYRLQDPEEVREWLWQLAHPL